jgi:hypothetical protein
MPRQRIFGRKLPGRSLRATWGWLRRWWQRFLARRLQDLDAFSLNSQRRRSHEAPPYRVYRLTDDPFADGISGRFLVAGGRVAGCGRSGGAGCCVCNGTGSGADCCA